MNHQPNILIIGAQQGHLAQQIQNLINCNPMCASDGKSAIAILRQTGHAISAALINTRNLEEDLEELVVYLRSTFPKITLAVLGSGLSNQETKRFKLLGVAHFISLPLTSKVLISLLHRSTESQGQRSRMEDWEVIVEKRGWVEVTMPTKAEYISRIQELLDLLERSRLDKDTRDELMLAIDELVTNAMEWGNQYKADLQVRVSYYCSSDRVMLKIEDEGSGFNTSTLKDPTEDLERHLSEREAQGKRPGGFGIHMIRNMMDEFIYNDRGNIVMFAKYLNK
jgi:anti-sigma regulatory factor (Ser/Thr protein kinase)